MLKIFETCRAASCHLQAAKYEHPHTPAHITFVPELSHSDFWLHGNFPLPSQLLSHATTAREKVPARSREAETTHRSGYLMFDLADLSFSSKFTPQRGI